MRWGSYTGPVALVWLPPEKQKYSHTVLPTIVPPASRMRVATVASTSGRAFHRRGAVHHRHAGKTDIVLESQGLAPELASDGARDLGLDVPRVVPVFLGRRAAAGQARVGRRGQLVRHPVEPVVSLERPEQALTMRGKIGLGQGEAELRRDFAQLLQTRDFDGIERHGG
jgi:hypothetical protein